MAIKRKSFSIGAPLTQGIEETIAAAKNHSGELRIEMIPIYKIELDPDNPRKLELTTTDITNGLSKADPLYSQKQSEKKALESIAKTIKDQGLINPILVYKSGDIYRLVAGERRTLASLINGEKMIQAKIIDGKPDPVKISLLQWIENVERVDLSLWERLMNLEKIAHTYMSAKNIILEDLTLEKFSELLGSSIQQTAHYKSLMEAPEKVKMLIKDGVIKNIEKAALISKAPAHTQDILIEACKRNASLKEMKVILEHQKVTNISSQKQTRGRQFTKINLGVTKDTKVVKLLLESLIQNESFSFLQKDYDIIDWHDMKAVNIAFKRIVEVLEKSFL